MSKEIKTASLTSVMRGYPITVAPSIPPLLFPNTSDGPSTLRAIDLPMLGHIFEHTGNCENGGIAASAIILSAAAIEHFLPDNDKQKRTTAIAAGVLGSTGAIGANIAYEAGVPMPGFGKSPIAEFDAADALYGSLAGVALSVAFVVGALKAIRKN